MDKKEILKFCLEKGFLIDPDSFNLLTEIQDINSIKLILEKISQQYKTKIISKALFLENRENLGDIISSLPSENQKVVETLRIKLGLSIELSKEINLSGTNNGGLDKKSLDLNELDFSTEKKDLAKRGNVRVTAMPPQSIKKLEVDDFVKHFKGRYSEMSRILQDHSELNNLASIGKISGSRQGMSIIGMVYDKKVTKNKNILFELEDSTGKIKAIVNCNKPEVYKKAEEVTLDAIIGIKCSGNREVVFVNDIIFPESMVFERKKSTEDEYAVFLADLHVGSTKFMEEQFLKFVDFLNGKENRGDIEAEKIKYLILAGDLIAGLGLYAGQEKDLAINNVEAQYARAAELLGKIRKDVTIIISPGNHDAIRAMEPQPPLDEKYAWPLYDLKNIVFVSNPATVNIGFSEKTGFPGFDILVYHGYSLHYYADNINSLREVKALIHSPDKIMAFLLKNRHLAPTHASTLYFPSQEDSLLIRKVPDILFSGHTHKSAVSYYNNILIISSSSWESKTDFQEKMGNEPDFCKVPVFNLKTRAIKILDFE